MPLADTSLARGRQAPLGSRTTLIRTPFSHLNGVFPILRDIKGDSKQLCPALTLSLQSCYKHLKNCRQRMWGGVFCQSDIYLHGMADAYQVYTNHNLMVPLLPGYSLNNYTTLH